MRYGKIGKIVKVAVLALVFSVAASARERWNGYCQQGGVTGSLTASGSTYYVSPQMQGSFPACVVNVYLTGTSTLAVIYQDNSGTPLSNPFTGDPNTGYVFFYADNGVYDVQFSGAGITTPFTIGAISLFDEVSYFPHNVYAYPLAGVAGNVGIYNGAGTFEAGFTAQNGLSQNLNWALPIADKFGCFQSTGAGVLQLVSCTPGGFPNSIQYNTANGPSSTFGGDNNFLWNPTTQSQSIFGVNGTVALQVNSGNIQVAVGSVSAGGGFISSANSYNGFASSSDGASLSGVEINQNPATGGSLHFKPITYNPTGLGQCLDQFGNPVMQPNPMPGEVFGPNDLFLWSSLSPSIGGVVGGSGPNCGPSIPVNGNYGLNTNGYFFGRGGLATDSPYFNAIQNFLGGVTAMSFTAGGIYPQGTVTTTGTLSTPTYLGGYMQMGHSAGPPFNGCVSIAVCTNPLSLADGVEQGTFYWDDALGAARVYNGSIWVNMSGGGGGGGTPGGSDKWVQFNQAGAFQGSPNLTFNYNTNVLNMAEGYMSTAVGFATVGTTYNAINAPDGGAYAKSLFAINYTQVGNSAGVPPLTGSQLFFPPGAMYWDTGSNALMVTNNSSAWVSVGGGSGSPGGSNKAVQFNSTGSFAGSADNTWDDTNKILTIGTSGTECSTSPTTTCYVLGYNGLATVGTTYNAVNAQTGGVYGLGITAKNYIQSGTTGGGGGPPTALTGSAFTFGAMYYDQVAACEEVFNGSAWNCLTAGSGGTPGGPGGAIQFNNTTFGGSADAVWDNIHLTMAVGTGGTECTADPTHTCFISVQNGVGAAGTYYNTFHANSGGMYALTMIANNYTQLGSYHGGATFATPPPKLTGSSVYLPGATYWNLDTNCEAINSVSSSSGSWTCLAGGAGGVSSVNGLTGAVTLTNGSTSNQITVTNTGGVGGSIALTLPQSIGITSNVTFGNIGANVLTTTSPSGGVNVLDNSLTNSIQTSGGISSTLGYSTPSTNFNSISTAGGISMGNTTSATLNVSGVTVIDNNVPGLSGGHFAGGISTGSPGGTRGSTVYIGPSTAGGSFFNYNLSLAATPIGGWSGGVTQITYSGISCVGVANGWQMFNLADSSYGDCNGSVYYYGNRMTPNGGYSCGQAGACTGSGSPTVSGTTIVPVCSGAPAAGQAHIGTLIYCIDCKGVTVDSATFDSTAAGGGHGTDILCEGTSTTPLWRVH